MKFLKNFFCAKLPLNPENEALPRLFVIANERRARSNLAFSDCLQKASETTRDSYTTSGMKHKFLQNFFSPSLDNTQISLYHHTKGRGIETLKHTLFRQNHFCGCFSGGEREELNEAGRKNTCLWHAVTLELSCTKGPTEGERKALQLTAEDASCIEAYLRIEVWTKPSTVILQRGDSTIATLQLTTTDTLIVDEGLQPNQTYRYSAQLVSPIPPAWLDRTLRTEAEVRTMDTTSHEFQWYIDTLGTMGVIQDVWIFDMNLAYAVGEIYRNDTTFNAAKWNGQEWELMRVPFVDFCEQTSTYPFSAKAIWAFNENDIWVTSGSQIVH